MDGTIHHTFSYNLLGYLLEATDEIHHIKIQRTPDPFGNIIKEEFSTGLILTKTYDRFNRPLTLQLPNTGTIRYTYDPRYLRQVERFSPSGELLYAHTYEEYDLFGNLLSENLISNLAKRTYTYDPVGRIETLSSPFLSQTFSYDPVGNPEEIFKNGVLYEYTYDALSQISSEPLYHYGHDAFYNRNKKNETSAEINSLNQLESLGESTYSYDSNGNMSRKDNFIFSYDALNRLTGVFSHDLNLTFFYDPLGRRLIKKSREEKDLALIEYYLYDGQEEIGAFTPDGHPKNLKVGTSAIELEEKPFVPVIDAHNNICGLIDPITHTLAASYTFTTFGEQLSADEFVFNPWRYASKRLDPETALIYFGQRYYDPTLGRWLTTDPAGFIDSINLYQYVLNNPYRYIDPNGEFVFAIPLLIWGVGASLPTLSAIITPLLYSAATCAVAYTGYKVIDYANRYDARSSSQDLVWPPYPEMWGNSKHLSDPYPMQRKKKGELDGTLSDDPFNDPNLEDISHPQAKEEKHHKFRDRHTGEIIQYDEAKPGETGHEGHDHYHRPNPNFTNKSDYYLDSKRNPVPKGSEASHLYPPKWVWWE